MRNKNGFVLAETLIVVIFLTVTLMSLYTSFATVLTKTRSKSNNDTIDTIYKTTFIKDLLDSNYAYSYTETEYSDSLTYYAMHNTSICKPYSYTSGSQIGFNNDGNALIVCDFSGYYNGSLSGAVDPLYDAVLAYNIEKIYLINFGSLGNNNAYNVLDASTIDYAMNKNKKLEGDYLVIKYKKKYVYPSDHVKILDFDPDDDYLHSSIQLTSIKRDISETPIYLYESTAANSDKMETHSLADGDDYKLSSRNTFANHPGQVIVGWTNSKDFADKEDFTACYNNKTHYEEENILCGKIGETIKVNSYNRFLYAVWCGDKTLEGAMECQLEGNTSTTDGLFKDNGTDNSYGDVNYVYRGDGGDNFVKLGKYCYSMISNFGSSDSIKLQFYGTYNSVKNECDNKTNFIPNSTTYFNYNYNIYSYQWMYANDLVSYPLSNIETMGAKLNALEIVKQKVKENEVCPYNAYCYFGDTVVYENGEYILKNIDPSSTSDNKILVDVTEKKNFASYEASGYSEINNSNFVGKYVCKEGKEKKCTEVYYYSGIIREEPSTNNYVYYTKFYKFKGGWDNSNYRKIQIFLSKKAEYKDGKYELDSSSENSITMTLGEFNDRLNYNNTANAVKEKLRTYKYVCSDLIKHEDNKYVCTTAYMILAPKYYTAYVALKDGIITWTDMYNYTNGEEPSQRTKSAELKNKIDSFYTSYLKTYEDKGIINPNATFCNNSEETMNIDLGNIVSDYNYPSYFAVGYKRSSYAGKYRTCDSKNSYLYSKTTANGGNGILTNPVGLLTYEELSYVAQSASSISNPSTSYLVDTASNYYLMTPANLQAPEAGGQAVAATGYYLNKNGSFESVAYGGYIGYNSYRAKPVISIYLNTTLTKGSGSYNNPFMVD